MIQDSECGILRRWPVVQRLDLPCELVWFSPPLIEFGRANDGAEETVWLHADPHALLDVPRGSNRETIQRAYRRLARLRHPDAGESEDSFYELHGAFRAALGDEDAEVSIQPTTGAWWSFAGFVRPTAELGAVVGLVFDVHDLKTVPLRNAEDLVHVSYSGEVLPLAIRYSRGAASLPVLRAKAGPLLESALLLLLCLVLVPILALALSLESYFLSDGSVVLFWMAMLGTVALGYGALVSALAAAGKPVPYPRRAVARLRGRLRERLVLPRGESFRD
jgi:hypothetical protein